MALLFLLTTKKQNETKTAPYTLQETERFFKELFVFFPFSLEMDYGDRTHHHYAAA